MVRVPVEQSTIVQGSPSVALLEQAAFAPGELDFCALFEAYFSYVFHTLRRLGVPARDVEDVTHDVFLLVYRRRDQYDPSRPVKSWLFGFAFRVAAGYRRLSRNRRELLDEGHDVADPASSAADALERKETLDVAFQALDSLELTRRAVFILHDLDGCTIPEAAAALGIPLNTAYSRLRLARSDFQKAARRFALRRGEP